jgi:hypothetical protein
MTAKDTADRAAEAIDFTMMHATHDAFRRDLGRLTAASAVPRPGQPARPGRGAEPPRRALAPHVGPEAARLACWTLCRS